MNIINPCIKCKWRHGSVENSTCKSPLAYNTPDYVTGKSKREYKFCVVVRTDGGLCGKSGKWFEEKLEESPRISLFDKIRGWL